jgi:hypothetical protein
VGGGGAVDAGCGDEDAGVGEVDDLLLGFEQLSLGLCVGLGQLLELAAETQVLFVEMLAVPEDGALLVVMQRFLAVGYVLEEGGFAGVEQGRPFGSEMQGGHYNKIDL